MSYDLYATTEQDVLFIVLEGEATPSELQEIDLKCKQLIRNNALTNVLIDQRLLRGRVDLSTLLSKLLNIPSASVEWARKYRIAVVEDGRYEAYVAVHSKLTQKLGLNYSYFETEEEALNWLTSANEQPSYAIAT